MSQNSPNYKNLEKCWGLDRDAAFLFKQRALDIVSDELDTDSTFGQNAESAVEKALRRVCEQYPQIMTNRPDHTTLLRNCIIRYHADLRYSKVRPGANIDIPRSSGRKRVASMRLSAPGASRRPRAGPSSTTNTHSPNLSSRRRNLSDRSKDAPQHHSANHAPNLDDPISVFVASIMDGQDLTHWGPILRENGIVNESFLDALSQQCDAAHLQMVVEGWQKQSPRATPVEATLIAGAILRRRR